MKSTDQLMLSIGALLATERERRGIPVEKAAKETRMRPQRIRDMESDDLSHFTNPSYARMFIIAYAKYLGIPMPTIMEHLPDRGESGGEDYHYLTTTTAELPSLRRDLISRPMRRGWMPALIVTSLITLVLLLLGGGTYLIVNLPRLTSQGEAVKPAPREDTEAPTVVEKTVVRYENLGLANLPAPSPTSVDPIATTPAPASDPVAGAAPANFTEAARITAPPKPQPIVVIGNEPSVPPTDLQSSVPAASPADDADRAFLLGSSPDQKIPSR